MTTGMIRRACGGAVPQGPTVRLASTGARVVGYAARFDDTFEPRGAGFIERIAPTAFDRSLRTNTDIRALWGHDARLVLGRTSAGTLRVWTDAVGLAFELRLNGADPDHVAAREKIGRRDVSGCSWAGFVVRQSVERPPRGLATVTLDDVDLLEISIVAWPAYEKTSAALRRAPGLRAAAARVRVLRARVGAVRR